MSTVKSGDIVYLATYGEYSDYAVEGVYTDYKIASKRGDRAEAKILDGKEKTLYKAKIDPENGEVIDKTKNRVSGSGSMSYFVHGYYLGKSFRSFDVAIERARDCRNGQESRKTLR